MFNYALQPMPFEQFTALVTSEQPETPFILDLLILDLRSEKEIGIVHIERSHNIPLTHLRELLSKVSADSPVDVYCEGGYRSAKFVRRVVAVGAHGARDGFIRGGTMPCEEIGYFVWRDCRSSRENRLPHV